ncbi:hypothetical protein [Chitinophaga pinensis]|uniref:hypothetical protein n=1 Tax=Chitinophaga pinensis TaxID=79329 RepID=UPI0039657151
MISSKGNHNYYAAADGPDSQPINLHFKERFTYLELPVNVLYKLPLGSGKFIAGAGGYIAYGLGGHSKTTGQTRTTGEDYVYDKDVKFKKVNKSQMRNTSKLTTTGQ